MDCLFYWEVIQLPLSCLFCFFRATIVRKQGQHRCNTISNFDHYNTNNFPCDSGVRACTVTVHSDQLQPYLWWREQLQETLLDDTTSFDLPVVAGVQYNITVSALSDGTENQNNPQFNFGMFNATRSDCVLYQRVGRLYVGMAPTRNICNKT